MIRRYVMVVSLLGLHLDSNIHDLDRIGDREHLARDEPMDQAFNEQERGLTMRIRSLLSLCPTIVVGKFGRHRFFYSGRRLRGTCRKEGQAVDRPNLKRATVHSTTYINIGL